MKYQLVMRMLISTFVIVAWFAPQAQGQMQKGVAIWDIEGMLESGSNQTDFTATTGIGYLLTDQLQLGVGGGLSSGGTANLNFSLYFHFNMKPEEQKVIPRLGIMVRGIWGKGKGGSVGGVFGLRFYPKKTFGVSVSTTLLQNITPFSTQTAFGISGGIFTQF